MVKPELRVYPPSSSDPYTIEPVDLAIDAQANFPAQLTATVLSRWEQYADEDDPANPIQRGAYVEYWEHSASDGGAAVGARCLFRGKVKHVARTLAGGRPALRIIALDKLQVLNETYALWNDGARDNYVFSLQTPAAALGPLRLYPAHDYGAGVRHLWWPDPASAAWLSTGASNSTMLGNAMASGSSPASGSRLKLAQLHHGIPPAGFLSIGSEWIEYNGYALDPADGYWYAHDIQRGALGTTAASHSAGATAYARMCKRIEPRARIRLDGTAGTTYTSPELLALAQCAVSFADGSFAFGADPRKLRLASNGDYGAVWAGYSVFDEEGAGALLLSNMLTSLLTTDPASGGPGFGGAYSDPCAVAVSLTPEVRLARLTVPRPTKLLPLISDLLTEANLRGGPSDAALVRYDSVSDTLVIETVVQDAAPAYSYHGEARMRKDARGEGVHSAVLVDYEQGAGLNLLASGRIWHTPVGTGGGSTPFGYQKVGGTWRPSGGMSLFYPDAFNISQNATAAGAGPVNLLTDDDPASGLALMWATLQAAGTHLYAWFPGSDNVTPDLYFITRVVASFELVGAGAGASGGGDGVDFELLAFDSFTGSATSSAPTAGTALPLSSRLCLQYTPGLTNRQVVTLDAGGLLIPARAVALKVNGYLDDPDCGLGGSGGRYGFKLLELAVFGVQRKAEVVALSGSYSSSDSNTLVAPESAMKLLDAHMGQHDVGALAIGEATRSVASSSGWLALLASLAAAESRSYEVGSTALDREGLASVGATCGFSDGFAGVVDSAQYALAAGRRRLTLRAADHRAHLVGGIAAAALPPPRDPELRRSVELRKAASGRTTYLKVDT